MCKETGFNVKASRGLKRAVTKRSIFYFATPAQTVFFNKKVQEEVFDRTKVRHLNELL
jgi:hypothetical protein